MHIPFNQVEQICGLCDDPLNIQTWSVQALVKWTCQGGAVSIQLGWIWHPSAEFKEPRRHPVPVLDTFHIVPCQQLPQPRSDIMLPSDYQVTDINVPAQARLMAANR